MAPPEASAKRLAAAEIYIEINETDGDAGIHIFLDGEGFDDMQVFGPGNKELIHVSTNGPVPQQGITELFFESAEPSFEEQSLEELLALFPQGIYRFRGRTTDGKPLTRNTRFTHRLPGAPVQVFPIDGQTVDPDNAVLDWQPVPNPPGSRIVGYEVIVSCDDEEVSTAKVGRGVTSITVPPEVFSQGDDCKWEVLAKERSGNQTISEAEFAVN